MDLFGEGDKVVGRLRVDGTNKGPFAGRPPTGKKVQVHSIRIYHIVDNKIVESWAMQDRLGLMEQLGFIQAAGESTGARGRKRSRSMRVLARITIHHHRQINCDHCREKEAGS